jgi:metal-sulfur cluster biosynthetic enzyme
MLEQLRAKGAGRVVEEVTAALNDIVDPCSIATGVPIGLLDMGILKDVCINGNDIAVTLRLTSPICWQASNIMEAIERKIGAITGGVVKCAIDGNAEWMPDMMSAGSRRRLRLVRPLAKPATSPGAESPMLENAETAPGT